MAKIEAHPGDIMHDVLIRAIEEAAALGQEVTFDFNEDTITVSPDEDASEVFSRVEKEVGYPILTREEMAEQARKSLEDRQKEADDAMEKAGVPDEEELRDAKVPTPESIEELSEYIQSLVDRPHDYGTCVYAMSMASVATFNYVAHHLGVTGFQASMADMNFLKRTRRIELGGTFIVYDDILWPQYWDDPVKAVAFKQALRKNEDFRKLVAEKAVEKLESDGDKAAPQVVEHWEGLAKMLAKESEEEEGSAE